jgi:hypothetical protein
MSPNEDIYVKSSGSRAMAYRPLWLFGFALALALTGMSHVARAAVCPNEAFRTGAAGRLADCRAYELVSPAGAEPFINTTRQFSENHNLVPTAGGGRFPFPGEVYGAQAAPDGEHLAFTTLFAPSTATVDSAHFLATRTSSGWDVEGFAPRQSTTNTPIPCFNAYPAAYSPDFHGWVFADGERQLAPAAACGGDEPALVPGEPRGFQNLFVHSADGSYALVNVTPPESQAESAWFQGASKDLSQVVFDEPAQLTSDSLSVPRNELLAGISDNLYEWSSGAVHLVTILPDGSPAQGTLANANVALALASSHGAGSSLYGAGAFTHAVSSDGSRVLFVANGNLYLRENPDRPESPLDGTGSCTNSTDACTLQMDAAAPGAAGPGGGGTFQWASADGSRIYFTDDAAAGLTADTVPGSGQNLYLYEVAAHRLTDVTAGVDSRVDGVSGASEDGTSIYFVAQSVLAAGAVEDQPNLYLARGGAIRLIATLAAFDGLDWQVSLLTTRVSPDGRFLAFDSIESLTGYDNVPADPADCVLPRERVSEPPLPQPCQEIFVYDAASGKLSCASCATGGASATGPAYIPYQSATEGLITAHGAPGYQQRTLSDDGRLFFNTRQSLVRQDGNGQADVYEWTPPGPGCAQTAGCQSLVSSGTSAEPSYFYDASATGDDVFFLTSQALLPGDEGADLSIYDARVDGGFPNPAARPGCAGEGCRALSPPPPSFQAPASTTFLGPEKIPSTVATRHSGGSASRSARLARALRACRKYRAKRSRRSCEHGARARFARAKTTTPHGR